MANPLTAVARGAINTVGDGAKRVKDSLAQTMPNPAKMAYGLGLGLGPLIQNIVKEMKKDKKTSDDKVVKKLDETKKTAEKSQGKMDGQLSKMTTQLAMSNALLKEIRNLQIKQIAAVAKQSGLNSSGRMIRESDARIEAATVASIAPPSSSNQDGSTASGIKTLLGIGLGGMALGELWKMIPSTTKDEIKQGASSLVTGVADLWLESLKSSPALTLLGTYMGAKMLGLVDLAVLTAKTGILAWKGASKIGGAIVGSGGGGSLATPAATASGNAAKVEGFGNTARRAFGMEQRVGGVPLSEAAADYRSASKQFGHIQGGAQVDAQMAAKYGAANVEAIKAGAGGGGSVASTAAEAGADVGKMAGALGKVASVASKALGAIGIAGSVYSGIENAKAGNTKLAALDAFSATTGAAALTAGATGIGAPLALGLGAASIVSGLASAIGSRFVTPESSAIQPASTATGQPQKENVVGDWQKDEAFLAEVDRVSEKYQLNKKDLIALMQAESTTNINPAIKNPNSSASGIIQFTEATAKELGTTTEKLRQMTRAQQMGYVDAYFERWGLPKGATAGDLYTAIFKPSALRSGEQNLYTAGSREYALNAGLDRDGSGVITRQDLAAQLSRFGGDASRDSAGAGTALASASGTAPGLTPSSLSSQSAMISQTLAQTQQGFDAMSKAMFGQSLNIDMSSHINNALREAGQSGGGLAGLMTSNPNNPITKMAFNATGVPTT